MSIEVAYRPFAIGCSLSAETALAIVGHIHSMKAERLAAAFIGVRRRYGRSNSQRHGNGFGRQYRRILNRRFPETEHSLSELMFRRTMRHKEDRDSGGTDVG